MPGALSGPLSLMLETPTLYSCSVHRIRSPWDRSAGTALSPDCGRLHGRFSDQAYLWRAVRRIAPRSEFIAMRNLSSTAGRWVRMRTLVAGGVAVPLADGCGRVGIALGFDAACSGIGLLSKGKRGCVLQTALWGGASRRPSGLALGAGAGRRTFRP